MKEPPRSALLHALGRPELRHSPQRPAPIRWFRVSLGVGLLAVGLLAGLTAAQIIGKPGKPAAATYHVPPGSPLPNPPGQFWPLPTPAPPQPSGLTLVSEGVKKTGEVLPLKPSPSPTAPLRTPTPATVKLTGPVSAGPDGVRVFSPVSQSSIPSSNSVSAPVGPVSVPAVSQQADPPPPPIPMPQPSSTPSATPQPSSTPTPQPSPSPKPSPVPSPTTAPSPSPTTIPETCRHRCRR